MEPADRSGRRRARGPVPRGRQVRLLLSDEELVTLRGLAGERGVSVQRMLVDDALKGREAVGEGVRVDEVVGSLTGLRTELLRLGNNLNQLVRKAQQEGSGVKLVEYQAAGVLAELSNLIRNLSDAVETVAGRR